MFVFVCVCVCLGFCLGVVYREAERLLSEEFHIKVNYRTSDPKRTDIKIFLPMTWGGGYVNSIGKVLPAARAAGRLRYGGDDARGRASEEQGACEDGIEGGGFHAQYASASYSSS